MNCHRLSAMICLAFFTGSVGISLPASIGLAVDPVTLWVKSLTVAPVHTPSAVVVVCNTSDTPYTGQVAIDAPEGWTVEPAQLPVSLRAGEMCQLRFLVKSGISRADNCYPITATATDAKAKVVHRQTISTASAPYSKPEIDGRIDDWNDAIPVTWTTGDRKTTISTFWNRRQFSLLVAVEESELTRPGMAGKPFDAVQIAIAAEASATGSDPAGDATRHEFLLVSSGSENGGHCYCLAEPGWKLQLTQSDKPLVPLAFADAQVAVRREAPTTYYECSLPWSKMRGAITPSEGREFCLSVLVHDPDGTGLRDWGAGAGLWQSERNGLAWSRWSGAAWPVEPPFDNKLPWGLCSSKY